MDIHPVRCIIEFKQTGMCLSRTSSHVCIMVIFARKRSRREGILMSSKHSLTGTLFRISTVCCLNCYHITRLRYSLSFAFIFSTSKHLFSECYLTLGYAESNVDINVLLPGLWTRFPLLASREKFTLTDLSLCRAVTEQSNLALTIVNALRLR